jgi:hypothetical protein
MAGTPLPSDHLLAIEQAPDFYFVIDNAYPQKLWTTLWMNCCKKH